MPTDPKRSEKETMDTVEALLPRSIGRVARAKSIGANALRPQPMLAVYRDGAFTWSTTETAIAWDTTESSRLWADGFPSSIVVPASGWYQIDVKGMAATGTTYYLMRLYHTEMSAANELDRDTAFRAATKPATLRISGRYFLKRGMELIVSREAAAAKAAQVGIPSSGVGYTRMRIERVGS